MKLLCATLALCAVHALAIYPDDHWDYATRVRFVKDFSYIYNISIISLTLNSDRSRLRRRYDIFRNLNQYTNLFDSTQLTNTNVDDFIKTNVDEGKTVYVRWIASPR